jgi:hypothetical protein
MLNRGDRSPNRFAGNRHQNRSLPVFNRWLQPRCAGGLPAV